MLKMGQHNRSDQGLLFGGGVPSYGWCWENEGDLKNARWVVSAATGPVAERIYNMYVKENLSYIGITERLKAEGIPGPRGGSWVVSMVARILKDPKYKGEAYNRTVQWKYIDGKKVLAVHPNPTLVAEGVVPAIVSAKLWEEKMRSS